MQNPVSRNPNQSSVRFVTGVVPDAHLTASSNPKTHLNIYPPIQIIRKMIFKKIIELFLKSGVEKGGHADSLSTGHAGKRITCAVIGYSKKMCA